MAASLTDRTRDALSGADFPADRNHLVEHATRHSDDSEVLRPLALLPEGTYDDLDAVLAGLADHDDRAAVADPPSSGPDDIVADDD